jgi:hypothetical protein
LCVGSVFEAWWVARSGLQAGESDGEGDDGVSFFHDFPRFFVLEDHLLEFYVGSGQIASKGCRSAILDTRITVSRPLHTHASIHTRTLTFSPLPLPHPNPHAPLTADRRPAFQKLSSPQHPRTSPSTTSSTTAYSDLFHTFTHAHDTSPYIHTLTD